MKLKDCHNFHDFRKLAKRRLPSPIFNYIDGAAEDETTYARNRIINVNQAGNGYEMIDPHELSAYELRSLGINFLDTDIICFCLICI